MADPVNVPNAPGVPAVNFVPVPVPVLLTADAPGVTSLFAHPAGQWGIYLNGAPVVIAQSVVSLEFKQEFAISDYPVEKGAFDTYDKVYIPFQARLRFTAGSLAAREQLLNSLNAVMGDLNFYDVVMPELIYPSVNFKHQEFRRTAEQGLGLLDVEVWVEQVMVNGGTQFSATKAPSGAAQVNDGTVQATTPTPPPNISILQQFFGTPGPQ